MEDQNTTGVRP